MNRCWLYRIAVVMFMTTVAYGQQPKLVLPVGHTERVNYADFSPDGKYIVSTSEDKTAKLWDIRTGKELHTFYGHTKNVITARFNADGKTITTTSNDNTIKIWNIASGNLLQTLEANADRVAFSEVSPDGKYFLIVQRSTNTKSSTVDIWDIGSGKLVHTLKDSTMNDIHSLDFSPDGKYLLTQNNAANAMMWNISSGQLLHVFKMKYVTIWTNGNFKGISSVKFSPDGKRIINLHDVESHLYESRNKDRRADVWDIANDSLLYTLDNVNAAQFSPDGKYILTYKFNDASVELLDAASGSFVAALGATVEMVEDVTSGNTYRTYHADWIKSVQYSPDGHIVTFSGNDSVKIWKADMSQSLYALGNVRSIKYSPDGKYMVAACWDSTAKVWDITSGKVVQSFNAAEGDLAGDVYAAKFSDNGQFVFTISYNDIVKVWNVVSGRLIIALKKDDNTGINTIKYSSDNKKIITAAKNNTIKIWDAVSGALVQTFQGNTTLVELAQFSRNGKYVLASFPDTTTKVWEVTSGKLLHTLKGYAALYDTAAFSSNGNSIVTGNKYGESIPTVWDIVTGRMLYSLQVDSSLVKSSQFSPDGKYLLTTSNVDTSAKIWDAASGKVLYTLKDVWSVYVSPDGKRIATIFKDSEDSTKIWDPTSGKLLFSVEGHPCFGAIFSPDGKYLITSTDHYNVKITDVVSGKVLHTLDGITQFRIEGKKLFTTSGDFTPTNIWDIASGKLLYTIEEAAMAKLSPDGKYIFTTDFGRFDYTASKSNTAKILDAASGKLMHVLKDNTGWVESASFSPNSKKIVTVSNDFTAKVWNLQTGVLEKNIVLGENTVVEHIDFTNDRLLGKSNSEIRIFSLSTGKLVYSLIAMNGNDYLNKLPNGYYMATQNATKLLHYVTKDLQIITFEQLDVKYNRPDKVLAAIGNTDTALINSYRKAYQKRIKKLGIDTTQFKDGYSVPVTDITNRDDIEYVQTKDKLILNIKAIDSTYYLERFNVWVNEVPLFGLRGIQTNHLNNIDTSVTITLSQGENKIETSVINVNGTESYKMPLLVNYTPAKPIEEKQYFIGIGINIFSNAAYKLSWSVKDIHDLALKLKTKYPNLMMDTLFDNKVTKENIMALKQKLLQLGVDDKIIVSYSGHGVLSKDLDYFLSTYPIDFNKPEAKGLPYDDLESLVDDIKPRKKLMLIDACHSGEVDKDEIAKIEASNTQLINNGISTKGALKLSLKKNLGMANSFELMQNLFVNVGRSTGATIISAAAGTQFALERNDLKNGVFTYSILEAMNTNNTMKISQLKYIISKRVAELTKGLQQPTSRNETIAVDWNVW